MSGIDTGGKGDLAGQTPDSGTKFTRQPRQGQTPVALQKRAADFEPKLKAAEQSIAQAMGPVRKVEEDEIDFAPLQPSPQASAPNRADIPAPASPDRSAHAASLDRMAAALSEAIARPTQRLGVGAEGGGLRISLDVPLFGAHAATVTVKAGEILVTLHAAPGLAPPDPRAMAEAARNLSLALLHRMPDRRLTLGYEEDGASAVDGADKGPGFNPLLGPVR